MIGVTAQIAEVVVATALVFLGQKPKPKIQIVVRDPRITYVPPQNKSFHIRSYLPWTR